MVIFARRPSAAADTAQKSIILVGCVLLEQRIRASSRPLFATASVVPA